MQRVCKRCGASFTCSNYREKCSRCRFYKKSSSGLTGRDRTRELVRKRDNYTCQGCRKPWVEGQRRFDVHHLNGLCGKMTTAYDKVSDMDGLITLCHKCHFNRHDWAGREKLGYEMKGLRDLGVRLRRIEGWTLARIGSFYGITHQRVSQILSRDGLAQASWLILKVSGETLSALATVSA